MEKGKGEGVKVSANIVEKIKGLVRFKVSERK